MDKKYKGVGWFEIPTIDLARATKFYEGLFGCSLSYNKVGDLDMAWFPMDFHKEVSSATTGSLVYHKEWYRPTTDGPLIYFTTPTGSLDEDRKLIQELGGHIVVDKKPIGEHGFILVFIDTEGNRIALHSMN